MVYGKRRKMNELRPGVQIQIKIPQHDFSVHKTVLACRINVRLVFKKTKVMGCKLPVAFVTELPVLKNCKQPVILVVKIYKDVTL